MPCRAKAAVYLAMSSPWPTLAAACWVARSLGRRDSPSGTRPDAIAPDDTSTSCVPAWTRVARAAARASIASPAISPSVVVKDEEPTFTTTLSAPSMSGRATSGRGRSGRGRVVPGPGVMERAGGRSRAARGPVFRVAAVSAYSAGHRRGPIPLERHGVVQVADQDLGARLGPRLGERLFHAQPGQPVRQVADRLIVT